MKPNFSSIKPFVREASYSVHVDWSYLREHLEDWNTRIVGKDECYDGLDLDPDFQRGHVWTPAQQTAYIEYAIRGGRSGRDVYFNNPTWGGSYSEKTVLVDGKQRIRAVLDFLDNKVPIFGRLYNDWTGRLPSYCNFYIHVNQLKTKAEVLEWYLGFNAGGTPHTEEELDKVRKMLEKELTSKGVSK